MFGGIRVKQPKAAPKKLTNSRNAFVRFITDKCYRDPYGWGLVKGVAFFAGSILAIRALTQAEEHFFKS